MISKKILITASLACVVALNLCAASKSYKEEELGLRKVDLYSEQKVVGEQTNNTKAAAGESKVMDRAFENAPPMIPHDVEGMLDMTKDNNMCLTCHMPELAEAVKATPIPKSHFFDMRTNKTLNELNQARFNCSACHAPQSANDPLVKNEFKADFRSKDGIAKSNLLDSLNEGVK